MMAFFRKKPAPPAPGPMLTFLVERPSGEVQTVDAVKWERWSAGQLALIGPPTVVALYPDGQWLSVRLAPDQSAEPGSAMPQGADESPGRPNQ